MLLIALGLCLKAITPGRSGQRSCECSGMSYIVHIKPLLQTIVDTNFGLL